jgi:SAM-dependent methyltransferase
VFEAAENLSEQVQPVPLRLGSSRLSKVAFSARRFADLQLATIWMFLEPRLSELRGDLLDVGCGEMPYRSCLYPDVVYTGIDVPEASAFAMRGKEEIVAFDGVSIPFPDASFSTVLCTEVLEHAREPLKLISEIERVLKPGGRFLATVPFSARVHYSPYDFHRFTRFALVEMLSSFDEVSIEERGNDVAVIANKLVVLAMRLSRPSRWSVINWPLLVILLPLTLTFVFIAHFAMTLDLGSKDDPLGYSISASKRFASAD